MKFTKSFNRRNVRKLKTLQPHVKFHPMELEKTINHANYSANTAAVEPLNKKLEDQAEIIQKQAETLQRIKENHEQNTEKILKEIETVENGESNSSFMKKIAKRANRY